MILYSQRDARWASHALGWGPADGTIGQYGCLDTVDAMIATDSGHVLNPAQMDEAFTAAGIFVRESTGTFDLLPDNALALAFPGRYQVTSYAGYRGDLIKAAVPSPDTYAVLWISTASVPTHFVIAYSADGASIADPWTGTVGSLSGYGGPGAVHKTVLVKAIAAPPPVAPVPVPLPTPPPVPVPVPTPPVEVPPVAVNPSPVPDPVAPPAVPTPPPAPVVPPIPVPDVPVPAVVAEAGITTSEWALVVRYLYQLAAVGTVAVVTKVGALFGFHVTIPTDLLTLIVGLEVTGAIGVGTYAVSRGIRKAGTTA